MRRSLALILWYSRLAALLPGTMIRYPSRSPNTLSVVSSRKLPWRLPSSGPWQAKQASERMGRTSRLKSTGFSGGFDGVCQAPSGGRHNTIAVAGSHRQMIGRIKDPPRPIEIAQPRIPYYVGVLLWKYLQLRSTPASILPKQNADVVWYSRKVLGRIPLPLLHWGCAGMAESVP